VAWSSAQFAEDQPVFLQVDDFQMNRLQGEQLGISFLFQGKFLNSTLNKINVYDSSRTNLTSEGTYSIHEGNGTFMVATIFSEGNAKLVFKSPEFGVQIQHTSMIGEEHQRSLSKGTAYVASMLTSEHIPGCGTNNQHQKFNDKRRRLSEPSGFVAFPGCYIGDLKGVDVTIGIGTDYSYFLAAGSSESTIKSEVESIVATTSAIYKEQMNVNLKIGILNIVTDKGLNGVSLHSAPKVFLSGSPNTACPATVNDILTLTGDYLSPLQINGPVVAHYQTLTSCRDEKGQAGLSFIGTLCSTAFNQGVSQRGYMTWRTFAHEVGHGFNSVHSFENGVGTTGGLMDYGNGKLKGTNIYGFGIHRTNEMCSHINSQYPQCDFISPAEDAPVVCGDEVVEGKEECECPNGGDSCAGCKACKIQGDKHAQCTVENILLPSDASIVFSDKTCCVNGLFESSSTKCGNGYCDNGKCVNKCAIVNKELCGISDGGCRQMCLVQNQCVGNILMNSKPVSVLEDGTKCETGTCLQGACVGSTTPTPTSITAAPTSSGCFKRGLLYKSKRVKLIEHVGSATECQQHCLEFSKCMTFSYTDDVTNCQLFAKNAPVFHVLKMRAISGPKECS